MKKIGLTIAYACFFTGIVFAQKQKIAQQNWQQLTVLEDSIKGLGDIFINNRNWDDRFDANEKFTKGLVKALKVNYSFHYPFDSLIHISKLYAPDSSFRIFTWQITLEDSNSFQQKGAIQMRTNDGSLKLYPLFDVSDFTERPTDSVRTNKQWIGAIYYRILLNTYQGKKYYAVLGFDDNNAITNKKWIDVITFNTNYEPQFGGNYFQYKYDVTKPKPPAYRFCLEYKKEAKTRMNYDADLQMIVFDHLISQNKTPAKKETLIPDGTYEGFKWVKGMWIHVPMIGN